MDRDYVIGVNVPNFVSIAVMAAGFAVFVMIAKKAMTKSGNTQ